MSSQKSPIFVETASFQQYGSELNPRTGLLKDKVESPTLLYPSPRGIPKHATQEFLSSYCGVEIISASVGELLPWINTLQETKLSMKQFCGIEDQLLHISYKNDTADNSVVGGTNNLFVMCDGSKKPLDKETYSRLIALLQADFVTPMTEEIGIDESVGKRKIERSLQFTTEYLHHLTTDESSPLPSCSSLLAPLQGGPLLSNRLNYAHKVQELNMPLSGFNTSSSMKQISRETLVNLKASISAIKNRSSQIVFSNFNLNPLEIPLLLLCGVDVLWSSKVDESASVGEVLLLAPLPIDFLKERKKKAAQNDVKNYENISTQKVLSPEEIHDAVMMLYPQEDTQEDLKRFAGIVSRLFSLDESNIIVDELLKSSCPSFKIGEEKEQCEEKGSFLEWSNVNHSLDYILHLHNTHEMLFNTLVFVHNWFVHKTILDVSKCCWKTNRFAQYFLWLLSTFASSLSNADDFTQLM